MDDWPEPVDHLPLFTIHNLALASDWLDEQGELLIDVYLIRAGTSISYAYFIRSMQDLRNLLQEYSFWAEIFIGVLRCPLFPVRGIANAEFLENALREFPEGRPFRILSFAYYPAGPDIIGEGRSHFALLNSLSRRWGDPVALGLYEGTLYENPDDHLIVDRREEYDDVYEISRTHESYSPYDTDPARYQWIVDMWRE